MREEAIFAAGCFWGVEARFRALEGVIDAEVGYTGGAVENPLYREVCGGQTGHAEACRVVFDTAVISYDSLLEAFWAMHNPTQKDRQGPDIGTQYRSAIFFMTPEQKEMAAQSKEKIAQTLNKEVATEITPASKFWPAEDYHQRYLEKKRQPF